MKYNRSLSIIKDRKAKRFFALGSFIVVSAALGFMFLNSQQSRATVPGVNGRSEVSQVSYRLYEASSGINPGSPLANTNTAATLPKIGADFRLRVGLQSKGVSFKKLAESATASRHNCAIMSDDSVYCWGSNTMGQLGTKSNDSSKVPKAVYTQGVLNGKSIKQVTIGTFHTCAIDSDNKAYCWGYGDGGRLGNGSSGDSNVPSEVKANIGGGLDFSQITVGYDHTCAISLSGKMYCWGEGARGQGGRYTLLKSLYPHEVREDELGGETGKQIVAGESFTCAVTVQGSVFCWGDNGVGRTGVGSNIGSSRVPTRVRGLDGKIVESIAVGETHACAVISGGQEVYCWGRNNTSQLGVTAFGYRNIASRVPFGSSILSGGKTVKKVYAGKSTTCMVLSSNEIYCWGDNSKGQMGSGFTTGPLPAPVKVNVPFTGSGETSMHMSDEYLCALRTNGELYCWGSNDSGRIGNGQAGGNVTRPTLIAPPGGTIESASMKLRVEYAKKGSAVTCSAVSSSDWQVVTGASKLAYSASGPADGTNINSNSTDPELPAGATTSRPQSVVRKSGAAGTFTNAQKISAGEVGVWDLALVDKGLDRNENYCVRVATDTTAAPGSSIDSYTMYPEFKTAPGSLDIRFRDNAGATIANPVTNFDNSIIGSSSVTTNALLSNSSSKQIEVTNTQTSSGWSVVLSASDGATAKWKRTGGTESYMFNGTNGDQGFLSVNFGTSSVLASGNSLSGSTCQTSGISKGVDSQFKVGTATANGVTLMSSSGSTGQLGCAFLLQNVRLNQTIPAYQKPGTYELPMTLTVTAQ